MENVAQPLQLLWQIKRSLERGRSCKDGILCYIKVSQVRSDDLWHQEISEWLWRLQQGLPLAEILHRQKSSQRKILLSVLERGLRGEAIYSFLSQIEQEFVEGAEKEIEQSLTKLPFKIMIPLLLLLFPAFLLLLFGPLLQNFLQSINSQ